VSLTGEIDVVASDGHFVIALGFGATVDEAAHAALGSLTRGFEAAKTAFVGEWKRWSEGRHVCPLNGCQPPQWSRSVRVLKTLEAKGSAGGRGAALSMPWGASRGPGFDGAYHFVWTRDLVECLGGLIAAGALGEIEPGLRYLQSTQRPDGHRPQNMHMSGEAFWSKNELDETALPLVFLHLVLRQKALSDVALQAYWPMVRAAARFMALRGPSSKRDRWENERGVTPFTIATEVVGLLTAAEMADRGHNEPAARYLRDLADEWNQTIDSLLYRRGGSLAEHVGVDGYYVRVRRPGDPFVHLDIDDLPKTEVSPDALALVWFGLRSAHDPRIRNTVRVIDAVLRSDLPHGPCWRRYPGDEYGEHADGRPFDGQGVGRPWPLLTPSSPNNGE